MKILIVINDIKNHIDDFRKSGKLVNYDAEIIV